jgi:signal transduction histidine kinase
MAPLLLTYLPALTANHFDLLVAKKDISNPTITEWGPFFKVNFILDYIYILSSVILIFKKAINEINASKKKFAFIIIAIVLPASVSLLTSFKIVRSPGFDLTPASFSLFLLLLTIAVLKYRFLNIVPIATHNIFFDMEEALLITDNENNIIETNKALIKEFGTYIDIKGCRDIMEFLSGLKKLALDPGQISRLEDTINANSCIFYTDCCEVLLGNAPEGKIRFSFYMKALTNKKGKTIGRIFSFKNNTGFYESILEGERNRISGDIHDNLSNMTNVITMNLEYAISHFEKKDEALKCVNTAYNTAKGINIKLRKILNELSPVDIDEMGLPNALEALFKKIIGSGVELEFFHSGIEEYFVNRNRIGYIIYKICMEAINNSFFNGKAKKITIVLTCRENQIKLFISDDGIGCTSIKKGRGLLGIEKNVQSLGGSIEIGSPSEGGFNIAVEIPL